MDDVSLNHTLPISRPILFTVPQGSSAIYAKDGYRHFNINTNLIFQLVGNDTLTLDQEPGSTGLTVGGITMTAGQAAFLGVSFQNCKYTGSGGALSLGGGVSMVTIDE